MHFPERKGAFSSGGHCGSVATAHAPLGCMPIRPGRECRGLWGCFSFISSLLGQ